MFPMIFIMDSQIEYFGSFSSAMKPSSLLITFFFLYQTLIVDYHFVTNLTFAMKKN